MRRWLTSGASQERTQKSRKQSCSLKAAPFSKTIFTFETCYRPPCPPATFWPFSLLALLSPSQVQHGPVF